MSILRNYKILILAVLVLAVLGIGSEFALFREKDEEQISPPPSVEEKIEEISPEDLGLTLMARQDKKAVKFEITNIKGIAAVDYELSYLAKGEIPRGVIGHLEVKPTDRKIASEYLDLGSCSRNVCKYDEGVTSVNLLLKITKTDGKIFQSEKELPL